MLLLLRLSRGRRLGAATVALLVVAFSFTLNYAGAVGAQTRQTFVRGLYPENRNVLSVALQLIDFMRTSGLQNGASAFWYNPSEDVNLDSIQSTYLWGDTWVGLDMPRVDAATRRALDERHPANIVLLCKQRGCRGGPAALGKAGYRIVPVGEQLLAAGRERVWVRAFRIPRFAALKHPQSKTEVFYTNAQSSLTLAPKGSTLDRWNFASALPAGWTGTAAAAESVAAGAPFTTTSRPWDYELVSPTRTLEPGLYRVALRGSVLGGGLDLGVLDAGRNQWIEQSFYWHGQKGFRRRWMTTTFHVDVTTQVQVILSNWVPQSASSRWQLNELRLVRTG